MVRMAVGPNNNIPSYNFQYNKFLFKLKKIFQKGLDLKKKVMYFSLLEAILSHFLVCKKNFEKNLERGEFHSILTSIFSILSPALIFLTTSKPSIVCPNTVYSPSR